MVIFIARTHRQLQYLANRPFEFGLDCQNGLGCRNCPAVELAGDPGIAGIDYGSTAG
jgi:hypothetical protein